MALIGREGFEEFKACVMEGKIFFGDWKRDFPIGFEMKYEPIIHPEFSIPVDIEAPIDLYYNGDDCIPQPFFERIK